MREAIGIGMFVTAALLGAVGLGYQLGCTAMAAEALRYKRELNYIITGSYEEEAK